MTFNALKDRDSRSLTDQIADKISQMIIEKDLKSGDKLPNEFDLAIMLCEGAFPLMETDEMNFQILKNAAKALKDKGKLIFTTLNGLFPLFHSVKAFLDQAAKEGNATCENITFDLMTFRDQSTAILEDDSGNKKELQCNERYYVPSEITWLLKSLDFKTINIYGATLGAFNRKDTLTTNDFEMLVIAEK